MPNSPYASVALIAVLVLLMYFVVLRPQKKRQQQQAQTLNAVEPGSRVMLTSGIFATVIAVGEKQMIVETSPGVRLTILKQAMSRAVPEGDEDSPEVLNGADEGGYQADHDAHQGLSGSMDSFDTGPTEPVWPPSGSDPAQSDMWAAGNSNPGASESSRTSDDQNRTSSLGESSLRSNSFDRSDDTSGQSKSNQ